MNLQKLIRRVLLQEFRQSVKTPVFSLRLTDKSSGEDITPITEYDIVYSSEEEANKGAKQAKKDYPWGVTIEIGHGEYKTLSGDIQGTPTYHRI